jgi:hypothetical protein
LIKATLSLFNSKRFYKIHLCCIPKGDKIEDVSQHEHNHTCRSALPPHQAENDEKPPQKVYNCWTPKNEIHKVRKKNDTVSVCPWEKVETTQ